MKKGFENLKTLKNEYDQILKFTKLNQFESIYNEVDVLCNYIKPIDKDLYKTCLTINIANSEILSDYNSGKKYLNLYASEFAEENVAENLKYLDLQFNHNQMLIPETDFNFQIQKLYNDDIADENELDEFINATNHPKSYAAMAIFLLKQDSNLAKASSSIREAVQLFTIENDEILAYSKEDDLQTCLQMNILQRNNLAELAFALNLYGVIQSKAGQQISSEGYFRSATKKFEQIKHKLPNQSYAYGETLSNYGNLLLNWEKRESEGKKLINQAETYRKSKPNFEILYKLNPWTPKDFFL